MKFLPILIIATIIAANQCTSENEWAEHYEDIRDQSEIDEIQRNRKILHEDEQEMSSNQNEKGKL